MPKCIPFLFNSQNIDDRTCVSMISEYLWINTYNINEDVKKNTKQNKSLAIRKRESDKKNCHFTTERRTMRHFIRF